LPKFVRNSFTTEYLKIFLEKIFYIKEFPEMDKCVRIKSLRAIPIILELDTFLAYFRPPPPVSFSDIGPRLS
jgi:hypothetical protein